MKLAKYMDRIGWTLSTSIFGIQIIMDQSWISPSIKYN